MDRIVLTLLVMALAGSSAAGSGECDFQEFQQCLSDLAGGQEDGDFAVLDRERLERVCNSKKKSVECAGHFIEKCVKPGERSVYEATTSGRIQVITEMCTEGTTMHTGFLQHSECFGKLSDNVGFCTDKFKESQSAIAQSEDLEERLKIFYGCCAFEWHRKCLSNAARTQCGDEASDFVYQVTTALGGQLQDQICSPSYSSCRGLHGEDTTRTETDAAAPLPSFFSPASLLLALTWTLL